MAKSENKEMMMGKQDAVSTGPDYEGSSRFSRARPAQYLPTKAGTIDISTV
jgi:hypothetical protein